MPEGDSTAAVLGSVSFGWLHAQGGFRFDEPYFLDPRVRLARDARIHAFVSQRFPEIPLYSIEAHLTQVEGRRRPVVLVGGLQPNLILGAAVGARFVFSGKQDPDITQAPLSQIRDLDPLWSTNWSETWPITLFLDQIRESKEALGDTHTIVPPYFWDATGRATTHGLLTTAQKLMGERFFLEMLDNPSFANEFLAWIVSAYVAQIRLLADAAGMEITGLHTGDCAVCMISPDQFGKLVLPHLNDFARRVGPLRLHSCGWSDHLLDLFTGVDDLAALNVGSNTSVSRVRELFGPIRLDLIPDARLLIQGGTEDVDRWVRQTLEENGGGPLEFQYHLDLGQPEENCLQIHRTLGELGIDCPRVALH